MVAVRYQRSIDQLDTDGQNMALEELNRMERRCIIRICLEGYGENYEEKFIKQTKAWFEIKVWFLSNLTAINMLVITIYFFRCIKHYFGSI